MSISRSPFFVASFTDAWIETYKEIIEGRFDVVASFTDAWIETGLDVPPELKVESHLLQMRGLKLLIPNLIILAISRIFYRCVD